MSQRRPSGAHQSAPRPGHAATPPAPHGQTLRLPNAPPVPGRTKAPPPLPPAASRTPQRPDEVEFTYVVENGSEAQKTEGWTFCEIWTRNRVYHIDPNLTCISVISRDTGRAEATHPLRGARLTGGERRNKALQLLEIFVPLPAPGTEAVFRNDTKKHGGFARTSTIERVVLRIRHVRIGNAAEGQVWETALGRSRPR